MLKYLIWLWLRSAISTNQDTAPLDVELQISIFINSNDCWHPAMCATVREQKSSRLCLSLAIMIGQFLWHQLGQPEHILISLRWFPMLLWRTLTNSGSSHSVWRESISTSWRRRWPSNSEGLTNPCESSNMYSPVQKRVNQSWDVRSDTLSSPNSALTRQLNSVAVRLDLKSYNRKLQIYYLNISIVPDSTKD